MNLYEYQAKGLFQEFSIPVLDSRVAFSLHGAQAVTGLGGDEWVAEARQGDG